MGTMNSTPPTSSWAPRCITPRPRCWCAPTAPPAPTLTTSQTTSPASWHTRTCCTRARSAWASRTTPRGSHPSAMSTGRSLYAASPPVRIMTSWISRCCATTSKSRTASAFSTTAAPTSAATMMYQSAASRACRAPWRSIPPATCYSSMMLATAAFWPSTAPPAASIGTRGSTRVASTGCGLQPSRRSSTAYTTASPRPRSRLVSTRRQASLSMTTSCTSASIRAATLWRSTRALARRSLVFTQATPDSWASPSSPPQVSCGSSMASQTRSAAWPPWRHASRATRPPARRPPWKSRPLSAASRPAQAWR
mmetsp:Transcript_11521/g.29519  ORF Transcript_11521/g.29519 Transcript_11521/m.29519 type:complete len:309 (+) Transcript_11521:1100-2026(+)